MKYRNYLGFIAVISLCFSINTWASPANPEPIQISQPDGSKITVFIRGDETQSWMETADGFTVAQDKTSKTWYYVTGYQQQKPILSNIKASNKSPIGLKKHIKPSKVESLRPSSLIIKDRSLIGGQRGITSKNHAGAPSFTKGYYSGALLMVLVDFLDQQGSVAPSHYADLLNKSIDYYSLSSMGRANLTVAQETSGTTNDGVIGWVRVNQNHPNVKSPDIFSQVVAAADPFIDFSRFDTDGDGHVMSYELSIIIVAAGYDMSGSDGTPAVWGHARFATSSIVSADGVNVGSTTSPYGSGYTGGYCMIGEQQGYIGSEHPATMGIVVHELGHSLLGLSDLYDNGNGLGGIGNYGVMGNSWGRKLGDTYSGETPVMMGAYSRARLAWANPIQGPGQHMLTATGDPGATVDNTVYKATTDDSQVYFLVENRQSVGYDLGMIYNLTSFGGLVIWHIDAKNSSTFNNPPNVDVEVPNTQNDAQMNYPGVSDFWYAGNLDAFNDTSTPNSKHWSGTSTGIDFNNISASAMVMSFNSGAGGVTTPTAVAGGPYSGQINQAITFDGSASSDPNSAALTYSWDFGDGNSATGVSTTHIYNTAGTYTVTLTVSNGTQSASDTTSANITAVTGDPVANAGGPYTGIAGQAIQLDGSGSSDPNGLNLSYVWSFGDNTPNGQGVTTSHVYQQAGTYNLTLWVSNGSGWFSQATTVTVTDSVGIPTANAGGPYTTNVNQALVFNGSASSDPNNLPLTYTWNFGDGSTASGVSPSHTYSQSGTYTVTLQVNNGTYSDVATTSVTVNAVSIIPVADAGGPYIGSVGVAVSLNASASYDPAGNPLQYVWVFGDGSPTLQGAGAFVSHTYAATGTYTIWLYVNNGTGSGWIADSTTVTISANADPVSVVGGPYSGSVGQAILFNGSNSYDPNGLALNYVWNFGDNTPNVSGAAAYHNYAAAGTYVVTLYVSNGGAWISSQTTVTVTATSYPPVSNAGGPYYARVGQAVLLSGANSYDPNGQGISNYVWRFYDSTPNQSGIYTYHTFYSAGTHVVELWVYNGSAWSSSLATVYVTY